MFGAVARFELRYQGGNPVFWIAAALFFLFALGLAAIGGFGGRGLDVDSPQAIMINQLLLGVLYMFATIAFVANAVIRDDDTKFGPILRSTRISKSDYLFGRFAGAFAAAALAFAVVPLGLWLGSLMPWVDPERVGATGAAAYAYAYAVIALPTIFLTAAIFFALATATRSMMATYLGLVAFLFLYFLAIRPGAGPADFGLLTPLMDPFGLLGVAEATRDWAAADRNTRLTPMTGTLLQGRLLWLGISLAFLGAAYAAYRSERRDGTKPGRRRGSRAASRAAASPASFRALNALPAPVHGGAAARAQGWARTSLEMKQVFRSPAFTVLIAIGLVVTVPMLWFATGAYGAPIAPTARTALVPLSLFLLVSFAVAAYYSGELVWREREARTAEMIDATPIPNWAYLVPKTIALSLVLVAVLVVGFATAIAVQLLKGQTDLELGKYLWWYLLPNAATMILTAVLAMFIQALSPSKYIGWAALLAYGVLTYAASESGFENRLYLYDGALAPTFSDMDADASWSGFWWFKLYWAAIAVAMLVAAHLLWRRGTATRFGPRLRGGLARLRGVPGAIGGVSLGLAALAGTWIYHNTHILNAYSTQDDADARAAAYERRFARYEALPQPLVTDVRMDVALYPAERRAVTRGVYTLRNASDAPIRDVHVRNAGHVGDAGRHLAFTRIRLEGGRLESDDAGRGYRIYRLDRPMAPGETRALAFETLRRSDGFRAFGDDLRLVRNGTSLEVGDIAPVIGMDRSGLLTDRAKRREHGLPAEPRRAGPQDASAAARPAAGGWTNADITVSTAADQTPIAPGRKLADATAGGRRTARFVTDAPIPGAWAIRSARYAAKGLTYAGVELAVHHHPAHARNVDRMLGALRDSLDYARANFGQYPFDRFAIVETTAYRPSTLQPRGAAAPFSEDGVFLAAPADPRQIDYVAYATAHEFAHSYWGRQIQGADAPGAAMLTGTLAQYTALMVMKAREGPHRMRRYLRAELSSYRRGRGDEPGEEAPLERVGGQRYVSDHKGGAVMYLLADRLGEDVVNRALARLLARFRFAGAPYPRSADLIRELRAEARTPADHALITDLTQRITIYDLRADRPTATQRTDGKWDITVPVAARKLYADGRGGEREASLSDSIAVGLFTAEPGVGGFGSRNVLMLRRMPIRSGRQALRFVTAIRPSHAGVDPYNLYIDREPGNNVARVRD